MAVRGKLYGHLRYALDIVSFLPTDKFALQPAPVQTQKLFKNKNKAHFFWPCVDQVLRQGTRGVV